MKVRFTRGGVVSAVGATAIVALLAGIALGRETFGFNPTSEVTAAWVQAIFSVVAIGVAVWVPWRIHQREQIAIEKVQWSYTQILIDAFTALREPIVTITAVVDFADNPLPQGVTTASQAMASNLSDLIVSMRGAAAILDELDAIRRLDQFGAIRSIFVFRAKVREHMPTFEREHGIVSKHPTGPVVNIAIANLGAAAWELRESVDQVLGVLRGETEDA